MPSSPSAAPGPSEAPHPCGHPLVSRPDELKGSTLSGSRFWFWSVIVLVALGVIGGIAHAVTSTSAPVHSASWNQGYSYGEENGQTIGGDYLGGFSASEASGQTSFKVGSTVIPFPPTTMSEGAFAKEVCEAAVSSGGQQWVNGCVAASVVGINNWIKQLNGAFSGNS